jgi:hypothetical protein
MRTDVESRREEAGVYDMPIQKHLGRSVLAVKDLRISLLKRCRFLISVDLVL